MIFMMVSLMSKAMQSSAFLEYYTEYVDSSTAFLITCFNRVLSESLLINWV